MSGSAIVFLVILGVIVVGIILAYNRLIQLRNQTANGWRQIDVQLKRRHDLIPNLVNTVKGVMEFERGTLERVIQARNAAMGARGAADAAVKEGELTQALGRFFALAENYPQLRSNDNVRQLQEELTTTENQIGFARQFYNDIATQYNIAQQSFPSNLVAGMFGGFAPAELFAVTAEAERQSPQVDLTLR